MTTPEIALFTSDMRDDFDPFFAIYASAFPLSEQKPKEEISNLLHNTEYTFFLMRDGKEIIGFSIFFTPRQSDFHLLEYMAVSPTARNGGLGSFLFTQSLQKLSERFGVKPLFIEIDSPDDPMQDQRINRRREDFYRKNGCTKIESFRYILGLKSDLPPPSMHMMVYYPTQHEISTVFLRNCIEIIYRDVYGRATTDPAITDMFAHLPETLLLQ